MANEFNADVDQINQLEILEPQLSSKQFKDWLDDKERDATVRQNVCSLCFQNPNTQIDDFVSIQFYV